MGLCDSLQSEETVASMTVAAFHTLALARLRMYPAAQARLNKLGDLDQAPGAGCWGGMIELDGFSRCTLRGVCLVF